MPSVIGVSDGKIVVGEKAKELPIRTGSPIHQVAPDKRHQEITVGGITISVHEGIKAIVAEAISRAERSFPGFLRILRCL